MMKDAKSLVADSIRTELDRATDDARTELGRRRDEAREELDERADDARRQIGERLFDLAEEKFPAEARQRRRKVAAVAFAAGVAAGAVGRHLLDR